MTVFEKIYRCISRKDVLLISIITFGLIIFHKPIELFLSSTVVKYALSYVDSVWYNDIIFLLIITCVIFLTCFRFRNYIPSTNLSAILFIATSFYLIYRICESPWSFIGIRFWDKIKYADILLVISLGQLLLFIPRSKSNKRTAENKVAKPFFNDVPIDNKGEDRLGYEVYTKSISEKILSSDFKKSFAIGINGKWGLGKTSFINLIKRKLKPEDIIEINFNAWNYHSPKAITKEFFEVVQEAIRPYHSSVSRLLIQYSNKLVEINSNTITQSIQATVSSVVGFESISSLHKEINEAIKSIDKKIIIYIDDLDRLDTDEIIEVIRLIRNTANFRNTFFIAAYDRNYVVNALKEYNPYKKEEFLEKIFQLEVTLPYFKKEILRYELAKKLKTQLSDEFHLEIDSAIIGSAASIPAYLDDWLDSMRDVTRLANAITLNINRLNKNVDFSDFIQIELLRLKYPSVYELLFRKTLSFLETISENHDKKFYYRLKVLSENEQKDISDEGKLYKTYFERFLNHNYAELSIPAIAIPKIFSLVNGLFSYGKMYEFHFDSPSHLSIIYPSRFYLYFAYNLLDGTLCENEFIEARESSQNIFNEKISKWVATGLEIELKNRFYEIKSFDSREDFEKVIQAIFHLAKQPSLLYRDGLYIGEVGFDYSNLINKLIFDNVQLSKLYRTDKEFKDFVYNLFKKAKSPYKFESKLIKAINKQYRESFILNKKELEQLNLNYLKRYCESVDKIDYNLWRLFNNNRQVKWIERDDGVIFEDSSTIIPSDAKDIVKSFVLNKDFDGFLLEIITTEVFNHNSHSISRIVVDIFDSWENFEEILSQKNERDSKYLKEFKSFISVFASNNYSKNVAFDFSVIPVNEKN